MEIRRRIYTRNRIFGRRYYSFIRVHMTDEEIALAIRYQLFSVRIDPSVIVQAAPEVRAIMNRIRNRWNLVVSRTTGFVFFDLVGMAFKIFFRVIWLLGRVFFGTRVPFRDMGKGAIFSAGSFEQLMDIEVHVLTNLCAIQRALEFGSQEVAELKFNGNDFHLFLPGLSFGAGLAGDSGSESSTESWIRSQLDDDDDDLEVDDSVSDVGDQV